MSETDPRLQAAFEAFWYAVTEDAADGMTAMKAALAAADKACWQRVTDESKDGRDVLMQGHGLFHGVPFIARWMPSEFHPDQPWVAVIGGIRFYDGIIEHHFVLPAPPISEDSEG